MKKYMLICFFISMLIYGKEWYNYKDEDNRKGSGYWERSEVVVFENVQGQLSKRKCF